MLYGYIRGRYIKMPARKKRRTLSFGEFCCLILDTIYELRLYANGGEALLKTFAFGASMFVGVYNLTGSGNNTVIGGAYLVFGISLLVEYVPMLFKEKKTVVMALLPIMLIGSSVLMALGAFSFIGGRPILKATSLESIALFIVGIIAIDMIVSLFPFTPPSKQGSIENRLGGIFID